MFFVESFVVTGIIATGGWRAGRRQYTSRIDLVEMIFKFNPGRRAENFKWILPEVRCSGRPNRRIWRKTNGATWNVSSLVVNVPGTGCKSGNLCSTCPATKRQLVEWKTKRQQEIWLVIVQSIKKKIIRLRWDILLKCHPDCGWRAGNI